MSGVEDPLQPSAVGEGGGGNVPTNSNNSNTSGGGNNPGINIQQQGNPPNVRVTATFRTAQNVNPTNNNNGEVPPPQNLFHMRDRLFLAIFIKVTLLYARACPKHLRRILEFCLLMQSVILLGVLAYIHIVYTRTPITCLSEYKDSWPRDGILRVEIIAETQDDYDLMKSYEKEERIRQRAATSHIGHFSDDFLVSLFAADTLLLEKFVSTVGGYLKGTSKSETEGSNPKSVETTTAPEFIEKSISETPEGTNENDDDSSTSHEDSESLDLSMLDGLGPSKLKNKNKSDEKEEISEDDLGIGLAATAAEGGGEDIEAKLTTDEAIAPSFLHTASGSGSSGVSENDSESIYFNKTLEEIEIMKMKQKEIEEETMLKSSVSDFERFTNVIWQEDLPYIVEYSLEIGFLRLSPETRQRLNIPVKIVTLNMSEACYGDPVSRFLLEKLLGYDDILMSSIKKLAEHEDNKGYLRNVITGEQFRFVATPMSRTSYLPALLIMLVFTVSVSMLLRYSHHQVFIFIVDLLNNIEGVGSIHIPAAPLFTVILALVGMETIMSEFFNDRTIAFYVIFIVWICDQYDSICSHTAITKTHWVRFFYLYHFAYYAYHYRFNGQHGYLALLVSWSFIQHSMVYFYHHYELPAILRQVSQTTHQNQNILIPDQDLGGRGAGAGTGTGSGNEAGAAPQQQQQQQQNVGTPPSSSSSSSSQSGVNVQRVHFADNVNENNQSSSSSSSLAGDPNRNSSSISAINDNSNSTAGSSINDQNQASSSSSSSSNPTTSTTAKKLTKVSKNSSVTDESEVEVEEEENGPSLHVDDVTSKSKSESELASTPTCRCEDNTSCSHGSGGVGGSSEEEGSEGYVMVPSVDMTMATDSSSSVSGASGVSVPLEQNNNPNPNPQQNSNTNTNNDRSRNNSNNDPSNIFHLPNNPPPRPSALYPVDRLVDSLQKSFIVTPRYLRTNTSNPNTNNNNANNSSSSTFPSTTSPSGAISMGRVEFRRFDYSDIDDSPVGVMDMEDDDLEERGEIEGGETGAGTWEEPAALESTRQVSNVELSQDDILD